MRKKVSIKVNQWYIIADELRKNLVGRSQKITQRKNVQNRANKSKGKKAAMKSHFFTDRFLSLFWQTRRKRSIMHTRFNENIANFPYDLENDLIMHTRFNENISNFPYDLGNDLLCQEENFLDITEHLQLYDIPVQRIKSFTSPHQDFPRFDNYFGNMNWFQLQEVAVYGSQSLPPQHQDILYTRKDLNEFNASEVQHLIWKMASLDIKDQCKELVVRDRNVSGALVKIPPKKRKNIPKVDLDTETLRVWKLLMEYDGSESIEETDKNKEEWWETQRNIFRGRVDSFIAKMHLIQGNRRFSPWKGSVTDSVVGVYLTQNVSDHLSSSAFMSLAARFPAYYRSKEVDDFEVPDRQESVASNTQICEGCSKINEMEHDVSASYADGSDATPTVEPNQNPLQAQDKNNKMKQDMSASYADVSDAIPTVQPNQNLLQAQDMNAEMEQDMSASYVDASDATPTVEPNQDPLQVQDKNIEMEQDMNALYADASDATPTVETNKNPLLAQDNNNEMEHDVSASYADINDVAPMVEPNQNPLQAQDKNTEMEQDMSASYADISDVIPTVEPNQNQLLVQDKPCVNENSNTFRKFLEAEEVNYLKLFCRVDIDESESSLSENKPSAITFDLNVSLFETSGGEFTGQQKSNPVEGPKATTPICSPQSEVTTEQGVVSANNIKYAETTLENKPKGKTKNIKEKKQIPKPNWDEIRKTYCKNREKETNVNYRDTVDWEAVRRTPPEEIAKIIADRGMHNVIARRIKEFLDRMYEDHDTLDLEWLRDVPPDTAKEFLLSIQGLGLKSVECVRLLTLHHNAFPVDTNVGRVATRLGWVPLQPLPDSVQIHLLNAYPMVDNIQKYLYPRLCTLDQKTLYELHYQLITFGKVFCTKIKPNCNACPMRAECRHYASAFASGRLALPGTKESSNVTSIIPVGNEQNHSMGQPSSSIDLKINNSGSSYQGQSRTCEPIIEVNEPNHSLGQSPSSIDQKINSSGSSYQDQSQTCEPMIEVPPSSDLEVNNSGPSYEDQSQTCEPIIEVPPSPEPEVESIIGDIEDLWCESDDEEIPTIRLNTEEFRETLKETMDTNKTQIPDADVSKAVIAFSAEAENIRVPPKKFIAKSRTMHLVYELPDFHPCLAGFEERDPNDPTPYLLAVWFTGEVTNSLEYTENRACVAANNNLEETVKATVLIPCRTANRGSFPLNGTYFQVNEVFADDETSHVPMDVPRRQLCNLPLRELGCGSSATSIFKALSTGAIQRLFWGGMKPKLLLFVYIYF
ncbi:transcriptional activator DEMETER-like [Bidens hawaiensis]|uniref:transcriptional activator DEMETER-like n=1 Tax=Bidens hawaiensis TaxID=980011 RepID=UPI00404A4B34